MGGNPEKHVNRVQVINRPEAREVCGNQLTVTWHRPQKCAGCGQSHPG